MELLGIPRITAGNLLLMINIGYILGAPTGGILSDKILKSRKKTIVYGISIVVISVYALSEWQNAVLLPLLGSVLFVIGFFFSFNQLSFAHIKELMPVEMSGSAMTGINFFTIMGAGVFIHGLGAIIEQMAANFSGFDGAGPLFLSVQRPYLSV